MTQLFPQGDEALTQLVEKRLGLEGVEYVKSCLQQGQGLCSLLLAKVISGGGQTFAPVPTGTDQNRAEAFKIGGLVSRRDTTNWLTGHLKDLCQAQPESSILFQDLWAFPTDRRVQSATSSKLLTGS